MHDIKAIRSEPERFIEGWGKRNLSEDAEELVNWLIAKDKEARAAETRRQEAEKARNAASKKIGQAKASGDEAEFERLRSEVAQYKKNIETEGEQAEKLSTELGDKLAGLPNLPADSVPVGPGEDDNVEARKWGEPKDLGFEARDHVALGEGLGMMDFETAAKISGSRFVMLTGGLARLERALAHFMLDIQTTDFGYTEVAPPFMTRGEALYGAGQLPKFEGDLFSTSKLGDHVFQQADLRAQAVANVLESIIDDFAEIDVLREMGRLSAQREKQQYYLIPTAEVPLTNIVAGQIADNDSLPRRYTAWTPCFRSEAGAAGRDTRGMIRLHQFQKVELVSVTRPEDSEAEHERMTQAAEAVLQKLELPYKVMTLSSGDMGFSAKKTYDLEVWLPSQDAYREISSVSNCGDFQARRMNARYRDADGKPQFVHTLNGSGVAVGRAMVAILENFQNTDGTVTIPEALRPYMGGLERLEPAA
ncbi:MAG: serine--tRNA ligase [Euryhalocaulis sp.]|uniref:serine--tRNA ligase n=1 Tax=Euryhalocaulis sp. TaxID=2744307 RepID=UPI0017D37B1A|nr:serine--tRNA ligase [Euryhalocaulis sp.]MBA4802844.1 serine--tRNA ligase [Euryhalocaulis sp.]